jgi:hypothetical protein
LDAAIKYRKQNSLKEIFSRDNFVFVYLLLQTLCIVFEAVTGFRQAQVLLIPYLARMFLHAPFKQRSKLSRVGGAVVVAHLAIIIAMQVFHLKDFSVVATGLGTTVVILNLLAHQEWKNLSRNLYCFSILITFVSVLFWTLNVNAISGRQGRFGGALDPNILAAVLTITFPFLIYHSERTTLIKLGALVAMFGLIIGTGSRTAIFCFAFYGLFELIARLSAQSKGFVVKISFVFSCIALGLFLSYDSLVEYLSRGRDLNSFASFSSRSVVWAFYFQKFLDNPFTGIGSQGVGSGMFFGYGQSGARIFNPTHAHNLYLDIAVKEGVFRALSQIVLIVSALCALILVFFGSRKSRKSMREIKPILMAMVACIMFTMGLGNFNSPWTHCAFLMNILIVRAFVKNDKGAMA